MPANKNQIRRIQTILKMLRQNRYPNFTSFIKEMENNDIAGAYKLSSKTFQRDIKELREEYGAPIYYDDSRKGFYLSNIDWYNEELMVEPFEMKAALLGERVACEILPEPLKSEMNKAVNALIMKNENGMAEHAELECFQVLCPEYLPKVEPNIFLNCYNAWEERKYLLLKYKSSKGNLSEKLFEPHVFAWNGGSWYLKGKVLKTDDVYHDEDVIKVLALHRIVEAEIKDGQFIPAPEILKKIKEHGLFDFEKLSNVEIEFFPPFDNVMYEKYFNTPGAIKKRTSKSCLIHLDNLTEYEAAQLVLSTCGNAKVHSPSELKLFMRRIANKILDYLDN
jgi:predicted DNA-binding transcriptional regulator YafY